jgi:hypothetical protein
MKDVSIIMRPRRLAVMETEMRTILAFLLVGILCISAARSEQVDVALVLAVDASQSVDGDEQKLQRDGYIQAITSPEVMMAIQHGPARRIAVVYVEWGSSDDQEILVPWTIIDGPAAAAAFAEKLTAQPTKNRQRTSISSALLFSAALFAKSGVQATRRVIDVSGDGVNNQGGTILTVRNDVVSQGITINGLPIMTKDEPSSWDVSPQMDRYYEDCVIGGEQAFMLPVHGFENFAPAIRMKLVMEIAGFQVPATVLPAAYTPTNCGYAE